MGGSSTDILGRVPNLLRELREIVKVPIKICHVIRNPFDNIRTISRFYHRNNLDPAIEKYFSRCLIVQKIRQDVNPRDWIDIHHEDIIASPEQTLAATCHFLGISAAPDYLKDCASIVFKEPRRRRFDVAWTQAQRQQVESSMGKHEYLSRYSFET